MDCKISGRKLGPNFVFFLTLSISQSSFCKIWTLKLVFLEIAFPHLFNNYDTNSAFHHSRLLLTLIFSRKLKKLLIRSFFWHIRELLKWKGHSEEKILNHRKFLYTVSDFFRSQKIFLATGESPKVEPFWNFWKCKFLSLFHGLFDYCYGTTIT